jgi:hypothetical protein
VLLQPTQTGVTIPTVTNVTNAVSVTGTPSVNVTQIAGQTASAAGSVAFPSSIGTSTYAGGAVASVTSGVTLAAGQNAAIAAVILKTPANLLATDTSGFVTFNNTITDPLTESFVTIPSSLTTSGTAETLTWRQAAALEQSVAVGGSSNTAPAPLSTATVTYYLLGRTQIPGNIVAVGTVSYNSVGQISGRTYLIAQPFPSLP